jgi:hypothetical protein
MHFPHLSFYDRTSLESLVSTSYTKVKNRSTDCRTTLDSLRHECSNYDELIHHNPTVHNLCRLYGRNTIVSDLKLMVNNQIAYHILRFLKELAESDARNSERQTQSLEARCNFLQQQLELRQQTIIDALQQLDSLPSAIQEHIDHQLALQHSSHFLKASDFDFPVDSADAANLMKHKVQTAFHYTVITLHNSLQAADTSAKPTKLKRISKWCRLLYSKLMACQPWLDTSLESDLLHQIALKYSFDLLLSPHSDYLSRSPLSTRAGNSLALKCKYSLI